MRVTEGMKIHAATLNATRASERMYEASRKVSSGLAVEVPSDDPVAYAAIHSRDARIGQLEARREAGSRARGDLELSESTLASAGELFTRAREIAIQMANGEVGADERAIAAIEVAQLRETVISFANARGASGFLFAGTANDTAPFDPSGNFLANDGVMQIEVADGVLTTVNVSGAKAFTVAGGRDVFADLSALETALLANDPDAISGSLTGLDASQRQLIGARTDAGLAVDRLAVADDVAGAALLGAQKARAGLAETDATTAISELVAAKTAYERNLEVTRQLLSLSITKLL